MKSAVVFCLTVVLLSLPVGCVPLNDIIVLQEREETVSPQPDMGEMGDAADISQDVPDFKVEATNMLESLAEFKGLAPAAQSEEFRRIKKAYADHPGEEERFELALVLLIPDKGFSNARQGRDLLQAYLAQKPEAADLSALAQMLVALVNEREKLETLLMRERESAETLARQLNELRNIENIMRQRELNNRPGL